MLTLEREETSALDYSNLNISIQETFTAIDRFEWQAVDEILQMREQQLYLQAGYKSFEEYCQRELYAWGGYRRINQLLGAKKVIDTVGELGGHIKNERQARPLLRLVKEPEKLKAAVSLAVKNNPDPSVSDFAAAAQKVVPQLPRKKQSIQEPMVPKIEEPVVPQKAIVTVSQQSHPRYGDSGIIEASAPNLWQQIVIFADGERVLINNADLDAASVPFPRERTYPAEYTEAIAALKEQHQQELERLSQELRIGLQTEATTRAEAQVQEQIQSLQQLYKQQREQNIQLQQRLDEMEGLRKLEIENQQLLSRIQELEHAVEERPSQQWGNTMTLQATKALNKQVKQALEKTIDLRLLSALHSVQSLAQEPPKENAQECLRLMGMALKNLASAMNNTQALEAAAIILGSEPTPTAIAYRAEQLEMLPQAVSDIRRVLAQPRCSWQDYWAVAQEYEVIKSDYWAELTTQETDLITALQTASTEPPIIGLGSIVAHADPYRTLYVERGEVIEDLGEEVVVAWDSWKEQSKKADRYFRNELRFWQPQ
jgi:DNA repair exonuclease SbcCD ATPase subunit